MTNVRISRTEDITGYRPVFVGSQCIGRMREYPAQNGLLYGVGFIRQGDTAEEDFGDIAELRKEAPQIYDEMKRNSVTPRHG